MDRRTRTVVVVGVAVATAAVASAGVYRAVQRMPVRQVEVAHQFVIMAARPLPLGTRVAASDLKRVGWPSSSPLTGGLTRVEDVVGRGLITSVGQNEPITEAKLAPREAGAGLAPAIPPGMRAISVKVNEVIGVAGFATPGARVDVVVTVHRADDAVSRVLVANVPVLTAGTRYDQEQTHDNNKPIPSTVVTLMVTPPQAEKIALASNEGQITLMLRNPLDQAEPDTDGAELARLVGDGGGNRLFASAGSAPPHPAAPKPAAPVVPVATVGHVQAPANPAYVVEVIRAGKRSEETVP
jgi:pilus assembly protein CpaB